MYLLTFFLFSFLLGIFTAAHDLKSEWVVVKGVSHFADGSANKPWEIFACVMAASLVSNILSDPFVFEQWPHHGGMYEPHKNASKFLLPQEYHQSQTNTEDKGP